MSSRAHRITALALLLCTACGGGEELSPLDQWNDPARGLTLHPDRRPGPDTTPHNEPEVQLPEADHAEVDRWPARRDDETMDTRFTLNVLRTGNTLFKGFEWPWTSPVAAERRAARIALRNELQRLTADPEMREPQPSPIVGVLLRADRRAPWSTLRGVVQIAHEPTITLRYLQWAVCRPHPAFASRGVVCRVSALLPRTEAPEDPTPLAIRLTAPTPELGSGTRLEIGGHTWSFGEAGEGFEDPAFLVRANVIWDAVEVLLQEAVKDASSAQIEILEQDHELWWAYVVKVFDLLLGAGLRDVWIPDAGVWLRLEEPDTAPPEVQVDDPLLTPVAGGAITVAVLLALALTLLALRRRS